MPFIPDQPKGFVPEETGSFVPDAPKKQGFWAGFTAPQVPEPLTTEKVTKYVPVKGTIQAATYLIDVYKAAKRIEADRYIPVSHKQTGKLISVDRQKQSDLEMIMKWQQLEDEKKQIAKTFRGFVGLMAGEMPAFMGEMYLTAGIGVGWKKGMEAAVKKGLKKYAATTVGKAAAKVAGWGTAAAVRTTIGLPQRYSKAFVERRLPEEINMDESGNLVFEWPEENPFISFVKAWGDTVIEVASETAGGAISKGLGNILSKANKLPFGKTVLPILYKGWKKLHPEKGWGAFVNKISTKAGYHGIIEEVGEEYLGDNLRAIFDTQDFGAGKDANILQRMGKALEQDIRNTPAMVVAFAIPGAAKTAIGGVKTETEKFLDSRLRFNPETKDKIISTLKSPEAVKKRAEVRPEIIKEHGVRGSEYTEMLQTLATEGINPIEAHKIAKGALEGQYPGTEIDFVALKEKLSDNEMSEVFNSIVFDERLLPFQRTNLMEAWNKVSNKGQLPTPSEIKLIAEFISPEIAEALRGQRTWGRKIYQGLLGALSLPKAVMASFDMSGPGRQGILLAPLAGRKIYFKSITDGVKALGSEKYSQMMMQNIETNPLYGLLQAAGVDLTDWRGEKTIYGKYEERFQSNVAQTFWGVRQSERAYVVSLNKLRADTFYKFAEQWQGANVSMNDYKQLAKFINHATGRGDISKYMQGFANFANATFFSPKLLISRFQTVYDLINPKTSWRIRKLIAADLVEFVGAGLIALWLLSLIPGIDVNKDPRNSDFGKIRYGNTRIDFWAGYSQIARFVTQMVLNQQKSLSSGRMFKPGRAEVFTRFLESKLSPGIGAALDIYRGQTFFGEKMSLETPFVAEQIWQRISPLFIQDVTDAIRFQGLGTAGGVAPLAFFGIGAMTYPESTSEQTFRIKDYYAQKVFGKKWDAIGGEAQEALRINYPQIKEYENQIKFERENLDFITKIQEENMKIGEDIKKALPKDIQDELDSIAFRMPGLSRYIGRGWYLNDARYKEYRKNVKADIKKVLPKIVSHNIYKIMPIESKQKFLNQLIAQIKKIRREEIKDAALKKDLINIMEVKNVR